MTPSEAAMLRSPSIWPLPQRLPNAWAAYSPRATLPVNEEVEPESEPLAPAETKDECHGQFHKERTTDDNRERLLRASSARRGVRQWDVKPGYFDEKGMLIADKVPRDLTLQHEFMSLEHYQRDSFDGRFDRLSRLKYKENQARFGSPYTPIFVPLAPGETKERYEARFLQWLDATHKTTLVNVENHTNRLYERSLRLQFAKLNAKNKVWFTPSQVSKKRARVSSASPAQDAERESLAKHKTSCDGQDSIDACRACGCQRCVEAAMRQLWTTLVAAEDLGRVAGNEPASNVDGDKRQETDVAREEDAIERRLLNAYDCINEMIVLNEQALDASVAGLEELMATNQLAEATQRQNEDDELRRLIGEESERRRGVLAMLIVYLNRHDVNALAAIISSTQASEVHHIQAHSHRKCVQLANEINELRGRLESASKQDLGNVQGELERLEHQRRQELLTIVHFDHRVRDLIRALCAQ